MLLSGIEGVYMSPKYFSDDIVDNLRRHFDIVDVIGQYIPLKKSGRNFLGLCPFHSEKTPSFSVSPDKQIFHCFGCGAGGDIFGFIMDIEGLDFRETVMYLANEAGINIPENKVFAKGDPKDEHKTKLLDVYSLSSKLYHYILLETDHGKDALNYLFKRGFTRDIIESFNIGYSPPAWDTLKSFLTKRGFSEELLEQAGVLIKTEDGNSYDRFRNRIIFPINDINGRIIAFGGRVLDNSLPKYLNSPETIIFNKSKILYNLFQAKKEIRKKGQAYLFEGYVDTISTWRAGVLNGIATLGTSLTDEQAKILKRYADEVIVGYDSDTAGQQATLRAVGTLQKVGITVKVIQLPQGLDPDDYINKFGPDAFKEEVIGSAVTATNFKLQFSKKDFNLNDETDRIKYLTYALDVIADLQHAIEREHYLKSLADEFKISLNSIKSDFNQIYYEKRQKKEKSRDNLAIKWNNIINNGNPVGRTKPLNSSYYNAEKILVGLMLRDKAIAEKVQSEIGDGFHVEDFAVLTAYLYSYYGKGYHPDINNFISNIDDKKFINLATKLAMMEINEDVTENELNDYIFQVKKYNLVLEMKKKREEQLKAERNKDFTKSALIGQEIILLRNKLRGISN